MAIAIVVVCTVVVIIALAVVRRRRCSPSQESPYLAALNAMIAGEKDEALRLLASSVREDPRNIDAYVKLGNLLRERGQADQAAQIHREALVKRRLPPAQKGEILTSLAMDQAAAGRWEELLDSTKAMHRSSRADWRVLALTRDAHENMGAWDKAIQAHRDVVKGAPVGVQPTLGAYRAHIGSLILAGGDTAKARKVLQEAVKKGEGGVMAHLHLGDLARDDGDVERAVAYWMKLVIGKPDCAHLAFDRLEKGYFEMGDFGRMMSVYEDVIAKAPSNVWALCGISRMHERKGAIEEAIRWAREAIKHEGDTMAGHARLHELLVNGGRCEEAAKSAGELLSRTGGDSNRTRCPSCGTEQQLPLWRCQKCRGWINIC